MKKGGGRRYYRREDISLLSGIRALLYDDGLSIKDVQALLKDNGANAVMDRAEEEGVSANGGDGDAHATGAAAAAKVNGHQRDGAAANNGRFDDPVRDNGNAAPESSDYDEEAQAETRARLSGALDKLMDARAKLNESLHKP